jgi:hypothetical protein
MPQLSPPFDAHLLGVATFDLSGLPKEYFTLAHSQLGMTWVKPIFQVIGMRSLLSASLALENFRYSVMQGKDYGALIVRMPNDYLAVLLKGDINSFDPQLSAELLDWVKHLDMKQFRQNPLYQAV